MFDYLKIEDQIHLPWPNDFPVEFKDLKLEFQTKSLDRTLSLYTIANDKHLYQEDSLKEDPEVKRLIDFHGTINFGAYHCTDLVDYSLDYEAKFTDGMLQDIKLISSKVIDHESRKLRIKEILEKSNKENNKIFTKLLFLIQKILVIYPLMILGIRFTSTRLGVFWCGEYLLSFYCPKVILGCKKVFRDTYYGISIDKITTEVCFVKNFASKEFSFKILGVGFSLTKFKDYMFENYA